MFGDNIFSFLKMSIRNFRSINRFGRRTMKNVRHLMWRVVNYDQFEGFTFHIHNGKKCNCVELYKQESCHAHTNFHLTPLKDVIIFEILSSLRLKINFCVDQVFGKLKDRYQKRYHFLRD